MDQFLALQTLKLVKMKINAEQFLSNGGFKNDKNKLFYISGNEETMIQKVQDLVISELKRIGYENIVKSNDVEIKTTDIKQVGGDLFGGSKILVYENPKKIDLEDLANIDQKKTAIIIKETKNSKIKKFFDNHASAMSILCYRIGGDFKRKVLSEYLKKNNLKMERDPFLFFLENTDNRYGLFINEVEKLLYFIDTKITIEDLRKILTKNDSEEVDQIFFLITDSYKNIIIKTNKLISSSSISFQLLQRIKFFFNIILESKNISDAESFFPRYLFKEKQRFLEIFKRTNPKKNLEVLNLIKRTELLLRKNESLFLSTSQRLLINIKKKLN